MKIDRCYCFQRTFAELREVAEATGARSVAALQAEVTFGQQCRLCHPYVRRMLRTGETVFSQIITDSGEPADEPPALCERSDAHASKPEA